MSAISASSTEPQRISASTLTVLPEAATCDDAARNEVRRIRSQGQGRRRAQMAVGAYRLVYEAQ